MSPDTFVKKCLEGEALADDIDDYVERWHKGGTGLRLSEFLGFTKAEYKLWAEKPNSLQYILHARRSGDTIESYRTVEQAHRLAARSLSPEDAEEVTKWLIRTGRLSV